MLKIKNILKKKQILIFNKILPKYLYSKNYTIFLIKMGGKK